MKKLFFILCFLPSVFSHAQGYGHYGMNNNGYHLITSSFPTITCTAIDTSYIPLAPYRNSYVYFNGKAQILRGPCWKSIQPIMGHVDSVTIEFTIRSQIQHYILGCSESGWVISSGQPDGTSFGIYCPGNAAWHRLWIPNNGNPINGTYPVLDSSRHHFYIVWHKSDSLMACYVDDTLRSNTNWKWNTSYSTSPFALGTGNLVNASEGWNLPTSTYIWKGGMELFRYHKFENGTDSSLVPDFNFTGETIPDSASYVNGNQILNVQGGVNTTAFSLCNGATSAWDSSNATITKGNSYTSLISPLGNNYSSSGLGNWNGSQWNGSALWGGVVLDSFIYAGGQISRVNADLKVFPSGKISQGIARYNINTGIWDSLPGVNNNYCESLVSYHGKIITTGPFTQMNSIADTKDIAQWNGSAWSRLDTVGLSANARGLFVFNDTVWIGGVNQKAGLLTCNNVCKWGGSKFDTLGAGTNGEVECFENYNSALILGGRFYHTTALGVTKTLGHIAKWDGTQYQSIGNTNDTSSISNGVIYAMAVLNGELYAGGNFTSIGGVSCSLGAYNGSSWRGITTISGFSSVQTRITCLLHHKNVIVGGGYFLKAGKYVASLFITDGHNICPLGYGTVNEIRCLIDSGDYVYAIGFFTDLDGQNATNIAKIYLP